VSPLQLFGLICIFAVVRLALHFRPATAPAAGGTAIDGRPAAASASATDVLREYLDAFIVAGLVALFLITFVIRTFYIPSGSMEPTLQIHDVLLVNEFEYRIGKPHDGDIVVFHPPLETPNDFIKRTIGSPGEQLRIHNGIVYRNGVALTEPYTAQPPAYELEVRDYGIYVDGEPLDRQLANIPPKEQWSAPDRIPEGCYFMMGDNRNNSEDSHIWGFAQPSGTFATGSQAGKKASFTGHAFLLFWPPQHMRILK
jgi:signal peptidase I